MTSDAGYRDLMRLLRRAALLSDRVGERMFSERIGAGRSVYLLLRTVDDTADGVLSQQALAGRLGLTKGAVSRHVATAQQAGWLTAAVSPVSRRENTLALTPAGQDLVERGRGVQAEYERRTSERLTEADLTAAVKTLSIICDLLEEEDRG